MTKAAVQIAQSMLNATSGIELREDGRIGSRTLRAYEAVGQDIRTLIDESTLRWERVKFSDLVRAHKAGKEATVSHVSAPKLASFNLQPRAIRAVHATTTRSNAPIADTVPPRMSGRKLEQYLRTLLTNMGYGPEGVSGIIAQIRTESSMGATLREKMHRTRAGAVAAKIAAFRSISDEDFGNLKTREQYFEAAYGMQTSIGSRSGGLGNTKPGDGGKYYGRGIIQETGRWNYQRITRLSGLDFINYPDKLASDWEWTWRGLMASIEARFGHRKKTLTAAQVRANVNPGLA